MAIQRTVRWFAALVVCLLAAAPLRADLSQPGPHLAGWKSVTVTRPNATTFAAKLFYPALANGQNAAFDAGGAPYPAIAFGHGFLQPVDAYSGTLQHLATHGYFVIASESEGGFFPSHANFASDLRHTLTFLEQEHANASSPFFQAVDVAHFGMSGHSMGGGASILATAADARVKALANLAAAETNPSAIAAMASVAVPLSLISGSQDTIVPVGSNGQLMYAAGDAPRLLPVIQGGYHCGFEDSPAFGGLGCDSGSIPSATQLALTRRLLTSFFHLYLKGDQSVWSSVWGPQMLADPAVTTTYDPGVKLAPPGLRKSGPAGATLVYPFTLTNLGTQPASYTLLSEDNTWPLTFQPAQTPVLAPGAQAAITVLVDVPISPPASVDGAVISARSDLDGATRCFARLRAKSL